MKRAVVIFMGALAFVACALPSTDEYSSGWGRDGGASSGMSGSSGNASSSGGIGNTDAGARDGASADTGTPVEEPGNLFADATFEGGSCGKTNFFAAKGSLSSDAHAGNLSCQTCRDSEGADFFSFNPHSLVKPPLMGRTYRARAWVKLGPNSFKDQYVELAVRLANESPFDEVEKGRSPAVLLTDEWKLLEASLTVRQEADMLDFFVGSTTAATAGDRCFLVDDVGLWLDPE